MPPEDVAKAGFRVRFRAWFRGPRAADGKGSGALRRKAPDPFRAGLLNHARFRVQIVDNFSGRHFAPPKRAFLPFGQAKSALALAPVQGRATLDHLRATLDHNGRGKGEGRRRKTAMGSQKRAFRNPYASSQHAAYMAQRRCKIGLGASARAFAKTISLISEPPSIFRLFSRFFTLFRLFLLLSICGARF